MRGGEGRGDAALRAVDLVDLLWMHQGSMGTRPFSEGNREYLGLLIDGARRLARALAEAPRSPLLPRSKVAAILELVEGQTPANAAETAQQTLEILSGVRRRQAAAQAADHLYLRGPLPPLAGDYARVVVYFGAAMGLGDQITFLQFLAPLVRHCRRARVVVYTLYPGLWPRLLDGVAEVSFRDDPLLPFLDLNGPPPGGGRELVVTADFEVFNLHREVVAQRRERDVLELSLGRMSAWLNAGGSPWIRVETFRPAENNYEFMHALARRLMPESGRALWEPLPAAPSAPAVAARPTEREKRTILVNPLTSKRLPFTPAHWALGIRELQALLSGRVDFEVVIYPGVERGTHALAAEICARLAAAAEGEEIPARLLSGPDGPLTPHTALPVLLGEIGRFDLCVTTDTFTAHLVPLYAVPTVVLAYSHFRQFWVPSRWSFNCPVEQMGERGIPLLARILALLDPAAPRARERREKAAALLRATAEATRSGLDRRALGRIESALAHVFASLGSGFPAYEEAQGWLLLWGRLAWAEGREPGTAEGLAGYLQRFLESEAFKLMTVGA